jgi:hypothetical protein
MGRDFPGRLGLQHGASARPGGRAQYSLPYPFPHLVLNTAPAVGSRRCCLDILSSLQEAVQVGGAISVRKDGNDAVSLLEGTLEEEEPPHAQEMLPYTVGCRLMLACGAVFEFLQNRDRISPNAGGDGGR